VGSGTSRPRPVSGENRGQTLTRIDVTAQARLDIARIGQWYEDNLIARAEGFAIEVQRAIDGLVIFPLIHRVRFAGARMATVEDYPYQVWYRYDENTDVVEVLRVLHERADRNNAVLGNV